MIAWPAALAGATLWWALLTPPVPAPVERLTAGQAVERALRSSRALVALAHRVEEERANVDVALRIDNPQLRVGDLRSDAMLMPAVQGDAFDSPWEGVSFGLRWRPPNLGSRGARKARAERRVDQRSARLEQARRALAAEVRRLHATALNLDERIALASTAVELRDEMRGLIGRRLEQHAATALDHNFSELDYLDAIADREELQSRRRAIYHQLLSQVGLPPAALVELAPDDQPVCAPASEPVEVLVDRARAHNPKLEVLEARLEESEADISRARLELIPWFDYLQLNYVLGESPNTFSLGSNCLRPRFRSELDGQSSLAIPCDAPAHLDLRFAITLPLFDWNAAELRGLRARHAGFEAQLDAARSGVEARVREIADELTSRVALYERYRASDASVVDRSLAQIRATIEAGQADLIQMAIVQRRALRTRRARLRALLRCQRTVLELAELVGEATQGAP